MKYKVGDVVYISMYDWHREAVTIAAVPNKDDSNSRYEVRLYIDHHEIIEKVEG